MQKLLIFLIFLFSVSQITAQQWLTKDQQWTYHFSGGFIGVNAFFKQKVTEDTVIQNQNCKKIISLNMPFDRPPRFAYELDKKVYAFNEFQNIWVKMYDFNLVPGDIMVMPTYFGASFKYKIEAVDIVTAGDLTLNRQRVTEVTDDSLVVGIPFDILEYIGAVGKPFDNLDDPQCSYFFVDEAPFCQSFVDGFDIRFICYSNGNSKFEPYDGCTVSSTEAEPTDLLKVNINPNPSTDYLRVSVGNGHQIHTLKLININGALLEEIRDLNSISVEMNTSIYPSGMYVLMVETDMGSKAESVVIGF
jgi:hypothetical protein